MLRDGQDKSQISKEPTSISCFAGFSQRDPTLTRLSFHVKRFFWFSFAFPLCFRFSLRQGICSQPSRPLRLYDGRQSACRFVSLLLPASCQLDIFSIFKTKKIFQKVRRCPIFLVFQPITFLIFIFTFYKVSVWYCARPLKPSKSVNNLCPKPSKSVIKLLKKVSRFVIFWQAIPFYIAIVACLHLYCSVLLIFLYSTRFPVSCQVKR